MRHTAKSRCKARVALELSDVSEVSELQSVSNVQCCLCERFDTRFARQLDDYYKLSIVVRSKLNMIF